ncbi:hypothetical protein SAMN04490205_3426 [Pseudomonas trivialis]|uniref:Uncharacterized protein n=1 Tax=Pseudomonas trivialis TaxID=200450 RepID=A0A0R2ZDR2_9PSED|nr:hypothetical protein TU79_17130 [Pseudomonas trivialis]SDS72546.1 hypothetical protein SAMN04490205_3426 [Pseudomonas trivialis]
MAVIAVVASRLAPRWAAQQPQIQPMRSIPFWKGGLPPPTRGKPARHRGLRLLPDSVVLSLHFV